MHFTEDKTWRNARYHCQTCSRPFDRKDTLARHTQIHDRRRPLPKTRRKACHSCASSKTRCNGERPACSACMRKQLACVYDDQQPHPRRPSTEPGSLPSNLGQLLDRDSSEAPTLGNDPALDLASPLTSHRLEDGALSQDYMATGQCHFVSLPPNIDPSLGPDRMQDAFRMPFDDMDFNSNLDWILDGTGGENFLAGAELFTYPGIGESQMSQAQTELPSPSARQSVAGGVDDDNGDEGSGNGVFDGPASSTSSTMVGGLSLPPPHLHDTGRAGDSSWETLKPAQSHLSLPALGSSRVLGSHPQPKFCSVAPITDRTWHALRKSLMLPSEHNALQTCNLQEFPSKDRLDYCIDLFFAYYHPMLAIVHQPTFDPGKDLVVTLTMLCIGVLYTDFSEAKAFSIALAELTRRLLVFMAEQDRQFIRTTPYITALLLQGAHGYCSGSERLFELSESCRSTLVHHAKCMGLFRFEAPTPARVDLSSEEAWREWIGAEKFRRLGWAVYKYDASVAYLHNNRPFLSTGDINLNLPASAEHWAAETAQSWAVLHPWSKTFPPMPKLRGVIRPLFDGTPNPMDKIADEEHAFLVVLTLVRMLWSLKEIRSSPINDLIVALNDDHGQQTLLRALDAMAVPLSRLSKNHTNVEMDRLVHRMQLIHIAHIYGAGDLMNWLYPYLRHGREAEYSRLRMVQWARENPRRMRDVAFHCAQILGLLRLYPNNMPLESLMIFHAGVVLSCLTTLLSGGQPSDKSAPLQLDELDSGDGRTSKRHAQWVEDGGNVQVSLSGVPFLCSSTGRQQVLQQTASLLKRQKVWGIARNLTTVVLSLGARDTDSEMLDAAGSLQLFSTTSFPHEG